MSCRQGSNAVAGRYNAVEFVQHGLVEALADAVGLRALGLGARMIDILDRKVELVFVPLRVAAILAAAVGQHPQQLDLLAVEERNDPIVERIRCRDRGLAIDPPPLKWSDLNYVF